jgi:hypothetical protein
VTSVAIAEALDSIDEACPECPLLEEA